VIDSNVNYIKLEWAAPQNDGGAVVTGYYIERRDKSTGVWIRLNEDPLPVSSVFYGHFPGLPALYGGSQWNSTFGRLS